jgi:hypothetical protein
MVHQCFGWMQYRKPNMPLLRFEFRKRASSPQSTKSRLEGKTLVSPYLVTSSRWTCLKLVLICFLQSFLLLSPTLIDLFLYGTLAVWNLANLIKPVDIAILELLVTLLSIVPKFLVERLSTYW